MIYGRNNLLAWFDALPETYVYFSIYRKGKIESGNAVFTNKEETNTVKPESRQKLDNYLKILGSGEFEIIANDKPMLTVKGRQEIAFTISQNEYNQTQQQPMQGIGNINSGVPDGYISKTEAAEIAQKKFEELMLKKENEDLKAKVAALEKDNKEFDRKLKGPWQEVISGIAPYAGGILKSMGIIPEPLANVAGIPANKNLPNNTDMPTQQPANEAEVIELTPEQQQQATIIITDFNNSLATVFPDNWLQILQQLTHTLQTNPGKIQTAIQYL
jgi:hypothetical protein